MVSVQQTNLLPKNASRNDAIFAQKVYRIYATTLQYLSSYGCAITMLYNIYIDWPLDTTFLMSCGKAMRARSIGKTIGKTGLYS